MVEDRGGCGKGLSPFNESRYRELLKGLEISEVMLSSVSFENDVKRVDAEYFKKKYLIEDRLRSKFETIYLGSEYFVTDGQHGYHEVDEDSEIRHLTAKNFKNWFANDTGADRLAKWVDENNKRSSLRVNDVILTTRGTVGYCALVKEEVLPANIDQDVARIASLENNSIRPQYLATYLNSKFGKDWTNRNQTGMVQQGLALWRVKELPIPLLNEKFQNELSDLVDLAHRTIISSKDSYQQAEQLLLQEIGLEDFTASQEPVNVKSFQESFGISGRLDAEYYQSKFDQLENIIKSAKYASLGDVSSLVSRGKQPVYLEDDKGDSLPVLNSKHIRENKIILENRRTASKNDCNLFIEENDVLINGTGVGTIGRTAPYLYSEPSIPDNHVTIVRTEGISPIYLSVYLNSIAGQLQVEKYFKGSSGQIELYPDDINRFLIRIAPKEVQNEIEQSIKSAFDLEKQSEHLLEVAKQAVEKAIEENEEVAMEWMKKETA